jgi:hypothetical protein
MIRSFTGGLKVFPELERSLAVLSRNSLEIYVVNACGIYHSGGNEKCVKSFGRKTSMVDE